MVTQGLLGRLEARPGNDGEVEAFFVDALSLVESESLTTAWFAVRFGRSEYGIFDVFPDEAGRDAHFAGPFAAVFNDRARELLAQPPRIEPVSVLAHKLPAARPPGIVKKGLLLTFSARPGNEQEVERFLRGAEALVMDEPATTAWFAFHLGNGVYGIFDVFLDDFARFLHLAGDVPRELAKNARTLLGSAPDLRMLDVVIYKLG